MQTSARTTDDTRAAFRTPADEAGQRLGAWELVHCEHESSLSTIHRARPADSSGDRSPAYAVKMLRDNRADDPCAVALFRREAQLGRSIAHPHLVPVLAAHVAEAPYYLVMPWLEGRTLRRLLDDCEPFDVPAALWIVRQAAEALGALAAAGWRHGDLNPSNLFVSPEGHVTVLDLGLARRANESDSVLDRCVSGTWHYFAPEAITSTLAADVRGDIYSLGVVLFEILTGRLPYEGDTLDAIVRGHLEGRLPDPRRLAPHLPEGVADLLRRMLAREPLRRPRTPGELADHLARLEVASFGERCF